MATIKLLDTNIVLYYLGGRLSQPLPDADYCISFITEMELFSCSSLGDSAKKQIENFLDELTIIDLESNIKMLAIALRKEYSLKLPDAIIASTALTLKADLLSNDKKFQCIPHLVCESLLLKSD